MKPFAVKRLSSHWSSLRFICDKKQIKACHLNSKHVKILFIHTALDQDTKNHGNQ
ncbi:hypothetical protein QWZ13_15560 [Reinekea marina]|uniref:hypothetical protein n=1 Tax=Reinekea marina TaxID=1310421 RepID=UPI0025B3D403|nr:hypothetical protein [Reinekea marina]MDN3650323.1 hypothetical protein [Reinekea marina]